MMNPNSFTAFPNATLHNKLLATLPKQTLQSAERLLAPSSSVPQKKHPSHPPKKQQDYYYSTFQAQQQQQQQQQQEQNESHQICSNCDATSTPLWRRSADDQILCNACGLYLKLHNAPRPKNLKSLNRKDEFITDIHTISRQPVNSASKEEEKEEQNNNICSNCATTTTPLWRRDNEGLPLCNACGLYLKLHNEKRPLSMKTNTVKKRQRTDSNERYLEKNSLPGTGVFVMSKPTRK
ncbi:glucocorticoid receptor-like (DNA-binding domain) [Backusella circina FSU 941]|nr:glucocorticoid receptor-like (DNA-binding domain) [Backusella circina FSU 941]